MTHSTTWKGFERRAARYFSSERNPLSGGNGKHSRSDSLHHKLFIEAKLRVKHACITLWDETKKLAKEEGKIPVVVLAEKNRKGFWILCHSDDLTDVAYERAKVVIDEEHGLTDDMEKGGKTKNPPINLSGDLDNEN